MATVLTVALLSQITARKLYLSWPFFTAYLAADLLHSVVLAAVYQAYGFESEAAYRIAWAGQAVVVAARTLAVVEFCRNTVGKFAGVWALAWRILVSVAAVVLVLALHYGKDGFHFSVITWDIGSEAFVATFVTGALAFARYYALRLPLGHSILGAALGLFSSCKILNDLVISRYLYGYAPIWEHARSTLFCAILAAWMFAFRRLATEQLRAPELNPAGVYRTWMPQVNQRLYELNEELSQFWKLGSTKS